MQPLAPIAVTGQDLDVPLIPDGIAAAITPGWLRAANESGYALQCSLGADSHWLQPWTVDLWPLHAVTSLHVHPVPLVNPLPPSTWSSLLLTVAAPYETIPGTYPASLDRHASSYYNRQNLAGSPFAVLANSSSAAIPFVLPAGTVAVRLNFSADGGLNSIRAAVRVTSNSTGPDFIQFFGNTGGTAATVDTTQPTTIPISTETGDTTVLVSVSNNSSFNIHVYVSALAGVEAMGVRPVGPPAAWQSAKGLNGLMISSPGLGVDFTLLAALAGGAYRLFDQVYDTNSASPVDLSLWDGPSANGINVARLRQRGTTTPMHWNGSGGLLGASDALVGRVDAGDATTSVWASIARSVE